jgi:hypothetical protein
MNYIYQYRAGKGHFELKVSLPGTSKAIYQAAYPSYSEDHQTGELLEDQNPIELGIMKSVDDVQGLQAFLLKNHIISDADTLELAETFSEGGTTQRDNDDYMSDMSRKLKLSESERNLIKRFLEIGKTDGDAEKIIALADKIAAHDKKQQRGLEHVAEAIQYQLTEEPLYGRIGIGDLESFFQHGRFQLAGMERLQELDVLPVEGEMDMAKARELEGLWSKLQLNEGSREESIAKNLIRTYYQRVLLPQAEEDQNRGLDAINHLIGLCRNIREDREKNKVDIVTATAENLSAIMNSDEADSATAPSEDQPIEKKETKKHAYQSFLKHFKDDYGCDAQKVYARFVEIEKNHRSSMDAVHMAIAMENPDADTKGFSYKTDLFVALMETDLLEKIKLKKQEKIDVIVGKTYGGLVNIHPIHKTMPKKQSDPYKLFEGIVSKDDLRPAMTGVFVDVARQRLVGTNAHILAVLPQSVSGDNRILSIKDKKEIDSRYPDYSVVIPMDNPIRIKGVNLKTWWPKLCGMAAASKLCDNENAVGCCIRSEYGEQFFDPTYLLAIASFFLASGIEQVDLEIKVKDSKSVYGKGMIVRASSIKEMFALIMPLYAESNTAIFDYLEVPAATLKGQKDFSKKERIEEKKKDGLSKEKPIRFADLHLERKAIPTEDGLRDAVLLDTVKQALSKLPGGKAFFEKVQSIAVETRFVTSRGDLGGTIEIVNWNKLADLFGGEGVNIPKDQYTPGVSEHNKKIAAMADSITGGFTKAEVLNREWDKMKEKLGEKKARKYFDQVEALIPQLKNEIIECRTNGVVVKEGGKYMLYVLGDMELKKWRIAHKLDVTDQFTGEAVKESDPVVKPKVGEVWYDKKKDSDVTIKRVFKPAKGTFLENEPFLIDVKYPDGKGAINMPLADRFVPKQSGEAKEQKETFSIDTDTPLVPEVVADSVARDEVDENKKTKDLPDEKKHLIVDELVTHLAARAREQYQASEHFRNQINADGNKGRQNFYMFMHHWSGAFLGKLKLSDYSKAEGNTSLYEVQKAFEKEQHDEKNGGDKLRASLRKYKPSKEVLAAVGKPDISGKNFVKLDFLFGENDHYTITVDQAKDYFHVYSGSGATGEWKQLDQATAESAYDIDKEILKLHGLVVEHSKGVQALKEKYATADKVDGSEKTYTSEEIDKMQEDNLFESAMADYQAASPEKKKQYRKHVEDNLAKHEHGMKHIGMGLDEQKVRAGKRFLEAISGESFEESKAATYKHIGSTQEEKEPQMTWQIEQIEASGYAFTGYVTSNAALYNMRNIAHKLDISLGDIRFNYLGDHQWGVFRKKGSKATYKEEAMLPGGKEQHEVKKQEPKKHKPVEKNKKSAPKVEVSVKHSSKKKQEPTEKVRTERALALDKKYKAEKPGKHVSDKGNVYYEYRDNHTDQDRRKKFKKGGSTEVDIEVYHIKALNGYMRIVVYSDLPKDQFGVDISQHIENGDGTYTIRQKPRKFLPNSEKKAFLDDLKNRGGEKLSDKKFAKGGALGKIKFTYGVVEKLTDEFYTLILYNGKDKVYSATLDRLDAADVVGKHKKIKMIK